MSDNAVDIKALNEQIEKESAFIDILTLEMNKVIVGQQQMVERLLIGLLGQGHILLEGVPGLAKTLAINTLSKAVKGSFSRIQFTPDLLPADVIGTMIYNAKENDFSIKKGPVFANFVLADEINRAPAKVQSALLEAMQEKQVTIGDETSKLKPPFLVMATQNPVEQEGTYPLPEAQVDRFMLKVIIDYPNLSDEQAIVRANLNDSFEIESGLTIGRTLLRDILALGLPTATEALDPITPQYLHDLISWSAIGARTTESQTHREMASGLSSPVGFKNGTDGGLAVAVNALQSVANPHRFLGINSEGKVSVFETSGNRYGHIVLRGGSRGPNYRTEHIAQCETDLQAAGLPANIMVDCSHANSEKDPALQPAVARNVSEQIVDGNQSIIGLMLESHLEAGNQAIPENLSALRYGVSVTDGCIDWATTESLILELSETTAAALKGRSA